jgi:hypothetical protein
MPDPLENARQVLQNGGDLVALAEAIGTIINDPTSSLDDIRLGLRHGGLIAEQATIALKSREAREVNRQVVVPNKHLVGAAGTYYVAHCLSIRNIHAAVTLGNAPGVDIIASKADGSGAVSIQVKSRWSGCRRRWYKNEVWQWDVGKDAIRHSTPKLVYALVDYDECGSSQPTVFLVPSLWIEKTVGADWSRFIFPLRVECESLCRERWDLLIGLMDEPPLPESQAWATKVPSEAILG